jgi:Protein of unknown function (DUF3147).
MLEYGLRFLAGGIAVSAFAALGDTLRPKSFAGLFGAAPSIALATLLITLSQKGAPFVAWKALDDRGGLRACRFTAGQCACCSKNSCCHRGPRRWQLSLSGSLLRLVHPRPCFNSHDRPVQAFRPSSDALVRVSRQIRARRGDDRSRRPHRGPLRTRHWRPVSRLSRDLSRKRDIDRKACPGTQGESGSAGRTARQGSRGARCRRSGSEVSGWRLSAS